MPIDQASTDRIIQYRVLFILAAMFFLGAFSLRRFASIVTRQKFMPKRIPEPVFIAQKCLLLVMGTGALIFAIVTYFQK